MVQVKTSAVLTCPDCGASRTEDMPTDACQFFYECTSCATLLRFLLLCGHPMPARADQGRARHAGCLAIGSPSFNMSGGM